MMQGTGELLPHAVVILAGGTGKRLGGASKPDYPVAGKRLLDIQLTEIHAWHSVHTTVVVAPGDVACPAHIIQVLEDPPFGGPIAGIGAAVRVLEQQHALADSDTVALLTCDAPLSPRMWKSLTQEWFLNPSLDGVLPGSDHHHPNYLLGLYRWNSLRHLEFARHTSARSVFSTLNCGNVSGALRWCLDVDSPSDAERLEKLL
ncbi:molybdenum cofactor guanylyltransferase [Arcanobacterium canis]